MAEEKITHPSVEERTAAGKRLRDAVPVASHAGWAPVPGRPDPVALLEEQNRTREQDLVPVRHGRMLASPFAFYRGAAKIMAADLKDTPRAGLAVQLCGDAHLANFGFFASPERNLLFDLNDFDETLPGPFEYDVKRLAASFTIAARNNGFWEKDVRKATLTAVRTYREAMARFARMRTLDIWYAHLSEEQLSAALDAAVASQKGKALKKARNGAIAARQSVAKARSRDSMHALSKLAELVDGTYRIVSQPPIIVPVRELGELYGLSGDDIGRAIAEQLRSYRATLPDDRRHLLEQFQIIDVARKVVGVGSVGTQAFIALLQGRDQQDPLFLQVKEATTSVLEDHLPRSRFSQSGERVVRGQRMMQAASDIFLGWSQGSIDNRCLYWRQLRDMKGSVVVEGMRPPGMTFYAGVCGWTLARAHARSGDPIAIAAYLGKSGKFDESISDFAERYADQNERDYEAFAAAVRSGRLEAADGV
ncbi:DUF2252 domain-containing protein [Arthrobacter sp. 35W]|uniref:DUF2252 domain-containing protein n=1 Tax=Arthrobacter sp. 35W TaxID=1132441 RepID=UPI0004225BCD|nr:DUF2252 domain-containing protein [Arthrobacter sp. 35W]